MPKAHIPVDIQLPYRAVVRHSHQLDPENNPGKLKVAFFLWFYADYYILELDEAYRYAIVGSSSDKYLWILSREKNLPPPLLDELLQRIKDRGYDTAPGLCRRSCLSSLRDAPSWVSV